MTSPFVRLHGYKLRVQDRNGTGTSVPAVGTHVYLDAPGGTFQFNEYVVQHDGADAYTDPPLRIDERHAYWCVYGPDPLTPGTSFDRVAGFGYPLLARFQDDHGDPLLVLPGPYDLRVRAFNASTSLDSSVTSHFAGLTRLYADLHIDATAELVAMPAGWSTDMVEVLREDGSRATVPAGWSLIAFDAAEGESFGPKAIWHDGTGMSAALDTLPPQPNFGAAPFTTPAEASANLMLMIYVNDFVNMGSAAGIAWPKLMQLPQASVDQGRRFDLSSTAMFIIRRRGMGALNRVGHETGHCLLADGGLGRDWIGTISGGRRRVERLLGRLGLGTGREVYAMLDEQLHGAATGNLMDRHGGSSPPALTEVQVALMRAWFELGNRTYI